MPTLVEQVQAAAATFLAEVAQLVADSEKLDAVVHGPASGPASLVDLGSPAGIVKTIARVIAEAEANFGVTQVVTTNYAIQATDAEVFVNASNPVTMTMPDAVTWAASNTGRALLIKDVSGNAATNNITINRHGSDVLDGQNSVSIAANHGGWKFRPLPGGNWAIVG